MQVRYTGDQPVSIPSLGLDLDPGDLFEVDDDAGAGLVARPEFKAGASRPTETIAEVLAVAGTDIEAAQAALAAEQAAPNPRSTLVARLTQIIEEG